MFRILTRDLRGFNSEITFLEKGIITTRLLWHRYWLGTRKENLYSFWFIRFKQKSSIQLKMDYKDKTDSNFNFFPSYNTHDKLRFWEQEILISWKVHSEDFPYAKRCNKTNCNRWLKQRQEIASNLSTNNDCVFSVAFTRNLGTSVSAGGLGVPK